MPRRLRSWGMTPSGIPGEGWPDRHELILYRLICAMSARHYGDGLDPDEAARLTLEPAALGKLTGRGVRRADLSLRDLDELAPLAGFEVTHTRSRTRRRDGSARQNVRGADGRFSDRDQSLPLVTVDAPCPIPAIGHGEPCPIPAIGHGQSGPLVTVRSVAAVEIHWPNFVEWLRDWRSCENWPGKRLVPEESSTPRDRAGVGNISVPERSPEPRSALAGASTRPSGQVSDENLTLTPAKPETPPSGGGDTARRSEPKSSDTYTASNQSLLPKPLQQPIGTRNGNGSSTLQQPPGTRNASAIPRHKEAEISGKNSERIAPKISAPPEIPTRLSRAEFNRLATVLVTRPGAKHARGALPILPVEPESWLAANNGAISAAGGSGRNRPQRLRHEARRLWRIYEANRRKGALPC
jgi:hypothetical protein